MRRALVAAALLTGACGEPSLLGTWRFEGTLDVGGATRPYVFDAVVDDADGLRFSHGACRSRLVRESALRAAFQVPQPDCTLPDGETFLFLDKVGGWSSVVVYEAGAVTLVEGLLQLDLRVSDGEAMPRRVNVTGLKGTRR